MGHTATYFEPYYENGSNIRENNNRDGEEKGNSVGGGRRGEEEGGKGRWGGGGGLGKPVVEHNKPIITQLKIVTSCLKKD